MLAGRNGVRMGTDSGNAKRKNSKFEWNLTFYVDVKGADGKDATTAYVSKAYTVESKQPENLTEQVTPYGHVFRPSSALQIRSN